ncbi:MAG TPA: DNA polymerase III subunit delta' [Hyphomonadaceae bacterium]|jgi:DNA polymerase-3 subunit delta'|nr:DNA polymerase III subunit delta' [Hyphomonadaceae bacterium]
MEVAAQELGPVIGHVAAKKEFLAAASTDKLHHGWLLRGPRGVGKAKLALQFAAHLLGSGDGSLSTNAESHIGRLISGGNHPDLRVVRRPVDDKGKQKSEIPVDSVRDLSQFFSLRPAMGGWRVAIIDAVDELNRFGSNAILKTLEEPPARAVLFLISHGEQMLLPTIRSRCRVLRCGALTETETLQVLAQAGLDNAKAAEMARLAPGRPGRAMQLEGSDAIAASDAVITALRNLGGSDARSLHTALGLAAKSEASLAATMEALRFSLQRRAANELDPVLAGDWASAALDVMRIGAEADALNQDRAQTVAAALARVGRVGRF